MRRPHIRLERTHEPREEKDRVATQFELFAGILSNGISGRTGSGSRHLTYRPTHRFLVLLSKSSPAVTQFRLADHFRILAAHAAPRAGTSRRPSSDGRSINSTPSRTLCTPRRVETCLQKKQRRIQVKSKASASACTECGAFSGVRN